MSDARVCFPLLADPGDYQACTWPLTENETRRAYWLGLFRRHFPMLLDEAVVEGLDRGVAENDLKERSEAAREAFFAYLDELEADPSAYGELDILTICLKREEVLRAHAFDDPYRLAKKRENDAALAGLGQRLRDLAAMNASEQIQSVIRGVFAGNLYDLGATETAALYEDGASVDFNATLADLPDRPWRYDDLDALVGRLDRDPVRSAMVLVDNAGGDIGLGILPLAWYLLESAEHVVLAANETPSLNDVTVMELADLIERAVGVDDRLAQAHESGRLEVVSTGNGAPLIDLSVVTAELKEAAERTAPDLLVIEGMGRALESNFRAQFTVDTLKIAMIKDQGVADAFDASLYDLVCRFEPAVT